MIDLWENEPLVVSQPQKTTPEESSPQSTSGVVPDYPDEHSIPEGSDVLVTKQDSNINLLARQPLTEHPDYHNLLGVTEHQRGNDYLYQMSLRPANAFVLRYLLRHYRVSLSPQVAHDLAEQADKMPTPKATLATSGKQVFFELPSLGHYRELMRLVNGYPLKTGGYHVAIAKILDVKALEQNKHTALPTISYDASVEYLTSAPIIGFDGTLESLKHISIGELNVVKANSQSYKAKKKSAATMQEKLEKFGIATLYDLLLYMPRKYIDKSQPQDLRNLILDEPATIMGTIESTSTMGDRGASFTIKLEGGGTISAQFWRQQYLLNKFRLGEEVLVTGKYSTWRGAPQLNGTSIESAQEAAVLPVVPVYKQSESKGITTAFLVAAARELFSRLGPINLPAYLEGPGRINYRDAYQELHLPTTLEHYRKVVDSLAYYELVMMQVLIQESRQATTKRQGLVQKPGPRKLQEKAIRGLPFSLTDAQQRAVKLTNQKMQEDTPGNILLNADVGAGKTVVAQLACLRSVEAGHQAVLMAPTDLLARQLYASFERVVSILEEQGEHVNLCYIGQGTKATERKALQKKIAAGEVDIIVGTNVLVSKTMEYPNLGFIAIDEQQKFGAETRSFLLQARNDGRVPDLLQQTATPVPRSTAQVFYNDMDMILLQGKPPGRLPIKTEWLQEAPQDLLEQPLHSLWSDLREEAQKGNQTFIITPQVLDSPTVDTASVERTFRELSENVFSDLRVGFVHGKMKAADQQEVMGKFRAKEYDIMVASSVVEVGVDIPDVTRVVILSAERMGASTLHQIRGRAGRNSLPSKCYLVSLGLNKHSCARLESLVEHEDGFQVAQADLLNRGTGKIFGTEQSGASEMVFASLQRHGAWVPRAREEALEILAGPHREQALADSRRSFATEEGRLV